MCPYVDLRGAGWQSCPRYHRTMPADNNVFHPADAPDPERVYANYLKTCAMSGVTPVSRERA